MATESKNELELPCSVCGDPAVPLLRYCSDTEGKYCWRNRGACAVRGCPGTRCRSGSMLCREHRDRWEADATPKGMEPLCRWVASLQDVDPWVCLQEGCHQPVKMFGYCDKPGPYCHVHEVPVVATWTWGAGSWVHTDPSHDPYKGGCHRDTSVKISW